MAAATGAMAQPFRRPFPPSHRPRITPAFRHDSWSIGLVHEDPTATGAQPSEGGRSAPLRIAFVTETWRPSVNGVVTRLAATFRELSRRGHQVLVIAPAGCDQPEAGIAVVGSPSVRIPFIYGGQPWGLPLPRLAHVLDDFKPDLVHAVNPVLLGWAGIRYARARGVPLVCSYHTDVVRYTRYYKLKAFERPTAMIVRRAHRLADLNLVTSSASYAHLREWGLSGVRLWPGAVDLRRFHPRLASPDMRHRLTGGHPERRLVLYVGRLAAEKAVERLMPLAGGRRHLVLVGEGPARASLEAAFSGRQVTFAGTLYGAELAAAYASADVFAFPSTTDTLGLAVLEAMASGLPVVATRTAASAEVLSRARASRLVEAGDGPAMVAAVEDLLAEPTDREAVARDARRWMSTWADATDELLSSYLEVLLRSGSSSTRPERRGMRRSAR